MCFLFLSFETCVKLNLKPRDKFEIEISCCGSRFPDNAKFGYFTSHIRTWLVKLLYWSTDTYLQNHFLTVCRSKNRFSKSQCFEGTGLEVMSPEWTVSKSSRHVDLLWITWQSLTDRVGNTQVGTSQNSRFWLVNSSLETVVKIDNSRRKGDQSCQCLK